MDENRDVKAGSAEESGLDEKARLEREVEELKAKNEKLEAELNARTQGGNARENFDEGMKKAGEAAREAKDKFEEAAREKLGEGMKKAEAAAQEAKVKLDEAVEKGKKFLGKLDTKQKAIGGGAIAVVLLLLLFWLFSGGGEAPINVRRMSQSQRGPFAGFVEKIVVEAEKDVTITGCSGTMASPAFRDNVETFICPKRLFPASLSAGEEMEVVQVERMNIRTIEIETNKGKKAAGWGF